MLLITGRHREAETRRTGRNTARVTASHGHWWRRDDVSESYAAADWRQHSWRWRHHSWLADAATYRAGTALWGCPAGQYQPADWRAAQETRQVRHVTIRCNTLSNLNWLLQRVWLITASEHIGPHRIGSDLNWTPGPRNDRREAACYTIRYDTIVCI